MEKIILNKAKGYVKSNKNQFVAVDLKGSNKLLPCSDMSTIINANEQYNLERANLNLIRLSCNVNTICSNVLFNLFTEIVKDEGSPNATCLNFEAADNKLDSKLLFKQVKDIFTDDNRVYNAIDDTQLSNDDCGYKYHCGVDFFNNHKLRSLTFKAVNPLSGGTDVYFNTIKDYHRTHSGKTIGDDYVIGARNFSGETKLHIYNHDNILSFKEAFIDNLKEENGWFGFINKGSIDTYKYDSNDNKTTKLDISRPINYERACSFIDMYPDRTLYSFVPKYNPFRHRIEKNWNYCITYPSSSTTKNISFINDEIDGGALRIFLLDDTLNRESKAYCMSKHGLKEGDYVNIYSGNTIALKSVQVSRVDSEYDFYFTKNGKGVKRDWIEVEKDSSYEVSGFTSYKIQNVKGCFQDQATNFLTFSFKKVEKGEELNYYVRIFSKIPNWKFADKKINEDNVYNLKLNEKYSSGNTSDLFDNTISKLAFEKNVYNDPVGTVIYTDDINVDYLKDNLGRPITDFYFTIIKNNKGYKEWYSSDDEVSKNAPKDEKTEFSHCFGRITCGFYLNPLMYDRNMTDKSDSLCYPLSNSRTLCNKYNNILDNEYSGLSVSSISKGYKGKDDVDDEINFYENINFYGDLCSYSNKSCNEEVIQNIDYRFNTAQREMWDRELTYGDILFDDYDLNKFATNETDGIDGSFVNIEKIKFGKMLEGYYYNPHTKISFNTLSNTIETVYPKIYSIRSKVLFNETNETFKIITDRDNFFEKSNYFTIYDREENHTFECKIEEILNYKTFVFKVVNDKYKLLGEFKKQGNNSRYKIIKKDETIPSYAKMLLDGTCRFTWRPIYKNGFDGEDKIVEKYPFVNGRFYINKNINLYLRRQNPNDDSVLTNVNYNDFRINGRFIDSHRINNYYLSDNMIC